MCFFALVCPYVCVMPDSIVEIVSFSAPLFSPWATPVTFKMCDINQVDDHGEDDHRGKGNTFSKQDVFSPLDSSLASVSLSSVLSLLDESERSHTIFKMAKRRLRSRPDR